MRNTAIFIDPGTSKLGWCIGRYSKRSGKANIVSSGVLKEDRLRSDDTHWQLRCMKMCESIRRLMHEHGVSKMFVEMPHQYSGGRGGAANNSGAVLKLAFLVGALSQCSFSGCEFTPIPVQQWKGNVSKTITQRRVRRAWGWCPDEDNHADAIGLFDWYVRVKLGLKPQTSYMRMNTRGNKTTIQL